MKSSRRSPCFLSLILILTSLVGLGACAKRTGKGAGDEAIRMWEDSMLRATGIGDLGPGSAGDAPDRLLALQAAKADAYAKLKERMLEVTLEPSERVSDVLAAHPDWGKRLDTYIRSAHLTSTRFIPGRGFEVEAEITLGARFKSILGLKPREVPTPKPVSKPGSEPAFGIPSVGNPYGS